MKTVEEIKVYIEKCLQEHKDVETAIIADLTKLRESIKGNKPEDKVKPEVAIQIMQLKDRAMFHRAARLVLEDVLKEVNK